jgi:cbb3-type cytochrome oxidase subunit 3
MPDWLHLALRIATVMLFVAIFIGMVVWLFGPGSKRG